MASTILVGSTGLVGSFILSTLLDLPAISSIHTFARREPKTTGPKLQTVIEPDSSKWSAQLATIEPTPPILFSALATTRAQAGGFENQKKIDLDLNVEIAKAAKAKGAKVYVLISSSAISPNSPFAFSRMKAELEESVKALDFEHTIFVKPGLIVGAREDSRPAEAAARGLSSFLSVISGGLLKDFWAQDAEVIARAAVSAGLKALEGGAPKVWEVQQADILRLGRTEWKSSEL